MAPRREARSITYNLKTAIAPRSPFSIQGDVCLDKYRRKGRKGKEGRWVISKDVFKWN